MQRKEFTYLYIHANSLAELALQQIAVEIEKDMACSPANSAPDNHGDMEAMALQQLAKLDLSTMMDGFAWDTTESDAAVLHEFNKQQGATEISENAAEDFVETSIGDGQTAPDDSRFTLYLKKAYAAQDNIANRVEVVMTHANMDRIETFLDALPDDYPSITEPFSGEDLKKWLDCYLADHQALTNLVVLIRNLAQTDDNVEP